MNLHIPVYFLTFILFLFLTKFTAFLYELCPCCSPFRFPLPSLPAPALKKPDTQATNSDFLIPRVFVRARTRQFPNT